MLQIKFLLLKLLSLFKSFEGKTAKPSAVLDTENRVGSSATIVAMGPV